MARYNYMSDSEEDDHDFERKDKWNIISHFTVDDYLSCNETKKILQEKWNQDFEETEQDLYHLVERVKDYAQQNDYDFLSLAENVHISDIVALIRHHVDREYDLTLFEQHPELATPLVQKYDDILEEREQKRHMMHQKHMQESNKAFDWNTKKYK